MTTTTTTATATGAFTSNDCGHDKGSATSTTGLQPGAQAAINGNTDLSSCIVGPHGGNIQSITLTPNAGIYDWKVDVVGQGPSGLFSGSINLAFTDKTGDTYHLAVTSSRKEEHTVSYNSSDPTIVKIEWKN